MTEFMNTGCRIHFSSPQPRTTDTNTLANRLVNNVVGLWCACIPPPLFMSPSVFFHCLPKVKGKGIVKLWRCTGDQSGA